MGSVSLPDLPKGKEFEEYVSAFSQSGGNYIERNIIERDVEEVLELDIIATDYCCSPPEIKLVEVTSGEWGFRDLFKMRGWMDYLNIRKGMFVASKERDNVEFFKEKAQRLDIGLLVVPDLGQSKQALSGLVGTATVDDLDISTWRLSYWVERNLLKRLKQKKRSHPDQRRFKAMEEYIFEVNSGIFFTGNVLERVNRLYSAFQTFPRISAKCANELRGNAFDGEYDSVPKQVYEDTYYNCSYTDIQISTYVEHRARLAILKNAIDYRLFNDASVDNKAKETWLPKTRAWDSDVSLVDLPSSFTHGVDAICKHEHFRRYPVFWQWFLWLFGGFILRDYEQEEYAALSQKTGIPVDDIPTALDSYQVLFPQEDGWFVDLPKSNVRLMKMLPVPFMGLGANYRRRLYTGSQRFEDLKLTGAHTLDDLRKWNTLTVQVLQDDP